MEVRLNCPTGCETIYHRLNCGAKAFVLPRERKICVGAVAVSYGAADTGFFFDDKYFRVPSGSAHFMEHRMFEQQYGNVSERLARLGAEVNAFTDAGKTVYYFKTADNFTECLRVLLDFVKTPYFMKDGVDNEKSIIKNEIAMYDDDPNRRTFFEAAKKLYPDNPIACEIAGDAESVDKINPEILYLCHSAFYVPENMTVICSGNVQADEIIKEAERILASGNKGVGKAECLKCEPSHGEAKIKMDIALPRFCVAYPVNPGESNAEKMFILKLLGDAFLGAGSAFFRDMNEGGIMDEAPGIEAYEHKGVGYFAVSGIAYNPESAVVAVDKAISAMKNTGIDKILFEKEMKKLYGGFIRSIDDCEASVMLQAEYRSCGLAEIAESIKTITADKCNAVLKLLGDSYGVCIAEGLK